MDRETVEKGVLLLAYFLDDLKDKKEALDVVEMVTERPELQREILEEAERREPPTREPKPMKREVEASCRRCGRDLSTGYFLESPGGEIGPFGSTCIGKV